MTAVGVWGCQSHRRGEAGLTHSRPPLEPERRARGRRYSDCVDANLLQCAQALSGGGDGPIQVDEATVPVRFSIDTHRRLLEPIGPILSTEVAPSYDGQLPGQSNSIVA